MQSLSFEIIELIATLISANDRYTCLSVCRAWYGPFQRALYRSVRIHTRHQFKTFRRCLQSFSGSLVRELFLLNRVGITAEELDHLVVFCPLLETFDFSADGSWKHFKPSKILCWKHLRRVSPLDPRLSNSMLPTFADQLTHLTLRGKDARKLHSCSTLIPFLASLPRLQALTIGDLEDAWAYSELALDLTTIHQLLPDLSYLELWNVCLGPPLSSGGITIHGAAKLHTLKLMSHLSSWHWFHYLAYTYPNIKTMILNLRLKVLLQRSMSPKDFVEAQEAFLIMARSYTRLSTVVVDISPKLWPGQRFLDTLERTGTCLKEYHCIQKGWTPQMLKALTVCGATTLSKVHISLWKGTRDLLEIIQPLANCRQLEDLDLSCGEEDFVVHNSCTLNVFLNHLPNLKHLTLHTCTLYVSQEKDYTSEHGLRQLTLEDVCFSTAVMDYVSRRCRSLCDLRLDYCTKLRDHTHQEIRIDMPHHVFRSIRICHTFLSSEDRKRCNVDSTLLSLAQLDKQRRWRKNTDLDGLTRWYHMGDTNGNKVHEEEEELTRGWCLQRLTHEEIRLVKSFRMEPQQWKNLENAIRNTYKTKKRWETDLPYGYISIRCRSVDRLTFNHVEL